MESELRKLLSVPRRDSLRAIRQARSRQSLYAHIKQSWPILEPGTEFVPGKVIEVIADHLQAVAEGKIRRLLINVPPGMMKSLATDVFLPTWIWGPQNRPHIRFVSWSYAESLTIRDNLKTRRLLDDSRFSDLWPDLRLVSDQNQKQFFETEQRGYKGAFGIHGAATGHRGDILVVDDPHNVKDGESEAKRLGALRWLTETLPTRVNAKGSAIVIIMQRIHEDDVSGHILRHPEMGYEHLCLPMRYEPDHPHQSHTSLGFEDWRTEPGELLWPEFFDEERTAELEANLMSHGGEYAVAGQLQQRPVPRGGGLFKRGDFQFVDAPPEQAMRVRGWDFAGTSGGHGAQTAGVLISRAGNRLYIEDVVAGRWSPGQVLEKVKEIACRDGKAVTIDIPQDPGQAGKAQVASMAGQLHGWTVRSSPESGSKEDRARPLAAQNECGNLYLVRGQWNEAYINEACSFPMGRLADRVDASSRAAARLIMTPARRIGAGPKVIE